MTGEVFSVQFSVFSDLLADVAPYLAVLLALVGAWTICGWIWRGIRRGWYGAMGRWVYPPLRRRHDVECRATNAAWKGKLVRHAATGRIGLCMAVCVRSGLRDLVRPRWVADVILRPEIARELVRRPESEGVRMPMVMIVPAGPDVREVLPLRELTIAPERDEAAFRAEMEASHDE